jgi:hypothetical protein
MKDEKKTHARRWLTGATNSLAAAAVEGCESNITIATGALRFSRSDSNAFFLVWILARD